MPRLIGECEPCDAAGLAEGLRRQTCMARNYSGCGGEMLGTQWDDDGIIGHGVLNCRFSLYPSPRRTSGPNKLVQRRQRCSRGEAFVGPGFRRDAGWEGASSTHQFVKADTGRDRDHAVFRGRRARALGSTLRPIRARSDMAALFASPRSLCSSTVAKRPSSSTTRPLTITQWTDFERDE